MFRIKNEEGSERAEVYLYGTIGKDFWGDGNSAEDFAKQLSELSPKPLDIRIDSGGGDVYEGFAIASAIQRYVGETIAHVDGMAASAASYIALVCDKVSMNDYAYLMIHNAWCCTMGNAVELQGVIDRLNEIDKTICGVITKRSALTEDEVKAYMDAETWFSAEAAEECGMCQEVVKTEERMAASLDRTLASEYKHVPKEVTIADAEPISHPVSNIGDGSDEASDNAQGKAPAYLLLNGRLYRKETR